MTPDYVFVVGDSLRDDYKNGRSYYGLNKQRIQRPKPAALQPKRELLEWHVREVFRG